MVPIMSISDRPFMIGLSLRSLRPPFSELPGDVEDDRIDRRRVSLDESDSRSSIGKSED